MNKSYNSDNTQQTVSNIHFFFGIIKLWCALLNDVEAESF